MSQYTIIDPASLSYERIKEDLIQYVENLPDYSKWKDFYESGTGTTTIELLSGLGTFLGFHSLGARRESYLDTCKLYTSAINICNIVGYPVNRVSAPRLKINFTLTSSAFWDRTLPVFYYGDRSISLLSSQTLTAGTHEMEFVMGDWKSIDFISETNDKFANILVLDTGIDNNLFMDTLELLINSSSYPLVKYADEFLPNNVLIKTYQGGILLVFGDGYIGLQLRVNDAVKFNYINTLGPLDVASLVPDNLTKNLDCTINSIQVLNPGYVGDTIPKMAATAPGYLTSKRRMVTGLDHVYIFLNYSGSLISAGYKKMESGCCTILLAYLFDDEHIASISEIDAMYAFLDDYKMVGEELSIQPPKKIGVEMKMVCIIEEGVQQSEIEAAIKETIATNTMKLGTTFHVGQITSEVSKISGVIRVYSERPVSDKTFAYNEYLKLISLSVIVTAVKDYVVAISPDNNGYWSYLSKSTNTELQTKKLIDSTAMFTMLPIQVGSLISNPEALRSAKIVSIDSNTQLTLDADIFGTTGQTYEIYPGNV
ncbi:MAG: hypothetical protein WC511_02715 [Candidatus Pacearchaeota archaeon]